jgi:hypothetical protein
MKRVPRVFIILLSHTNFRASASHTGSHTLYTELNSRKFQIWAFALLFLTLNIPPVVLHLHRLRTSYLLYFAHRPSLVVS